MRLAAFFISVVFLLVIGCGGEEDSSMEISADGETDAVSEADALPTVTVYPGRGVYSDIVWMNCSPSQSDDWGEQYQPHMPGDTISFQIETGQYDLRCTASDLTHYYKWNVPIGEEGYVWEVTESDPDNLFRYYTHQTEWRKHVALVTLRNNHGCGVLSSLETVHSSTYHDGDVYVEHLNNQFIQPNDEITFRVLAGRSYTITVGNTYGERILVTAGTTIGSGGAVFEIEGN